MTQHVAVMSDNATLIWPGDILAAQLGEGFGISDLGDVVKVLGYPTRVSDLLMSTASGQYLLRAHLLRELDRALTDQNLPKRQDVERVVRLCGAILHSAALRKIVDGPSLKALHAWLSPDDILFAIRSEAPPTDAAIFDTNVAEDIGTAAFRSYVMQHAGGLAQRYFGDIDEEIDQPDTSVVGPALAYLYQDTRGAGA